MIFSATIAALDGKAKLAAPGAASLPAVEEEGGRARMRRGAYHTHHVRTQNTATRIGEAIAALRREGRRVTICAVADALGMSREHLGRRYGHLFPAARNGASAGGDSGRMRPEAPE